MGKKFQHIPPLTNEEEAEIQREIAGDPDAPEATDEDLALAKPFAEMFPGLCSKNAQSCRQAQAGRSEAGDQHSS